MSVVACRVTDIDITIASDSIMVRGWTQSKSENSFCKLSEVNGLILGSVGSAQEGSLFQLYCSTRKPSASTQNGILEFVSEFADWKRQKTNNFGINNSYILVFEEKAFAIENFFVSEILKYEAIGAGEDFALAALHLGTSVETAVKTACNLSAFCEEPIVQFRIEK